MPKTELIQDGPFQSIQAAGSAIFEFIEGYYNRQRRHSSLGLISTVYIQLIIKQLKKEVFGVRQEDLHRVSPAPFEHINRLGKYDFKRETNAQGNVLRPLRLPKPNSLHSNRIIPSICKENLKERMYWFKKGYDTGDINQGDTFSATSIDPAA